MGRYSFEPAARALGRRVTALSGSAMRPHPILGPLIDDGGKRERVRASVVVDGRGVGVLIDPDGEALEAAIEFAAEVVNDLVARPYEESAWGGLEAVVEEIQALGRRCWGAVADVADAQQVQGMIDGALEQLGRLDIVVNNAGIHIPGDSQTLGVDDWDRVMAINDGRLLTIGTPQEVREHPDVQRAYLGVAE